MLCLNIQEKTIVATALQKSKGRAALNFTLAEKLNKLIGQILLQLRLAFLTKFPHKLPEWQLDLQSILLALCRCKTD